MYRHIRAFFSQLDYLEVDTPLLADSCNNDVHIEPVRAQVNGQTRYLQTSPEFAMKRLLAAGSGSIYQICHAFRDEEQGRRHRAEFSLLEWYSVGYDYRKLMDQLQDLIEQLLPQAGGFTRFRYAECFQQVLAIDIFEVNLASLQQAVSQQVGGIDASLLGRNDCLDLLISEVIAPTFSDFTFVYDYPAEQASLARISAKDSRVAERFELFYQDMELANGFSELTDADEQRRRFEQDQKLRLQRCQAAIPLDEDFLAALQAGMPECAGVAVGLDRLLMVQLGVDMIDQVHQPFDTTLAQDL